MKLSATYRISPDEKNIKINPKCVSGEMVPVLTGSGVFLPCCMCGLGDRNNILKEDPYFVENGFYDLNIRDADDITSEIFQSDIWLDFFQLLADNPSDVPACCKRTCGVKNEPI